MAHDPVNHPRHYTSHPSGIECITITEHMGFNLGNALKYIWRADLKNDAIEDLKKARWYLDREIAKRDAAKSTEASTALAARAIPVGAGQGDAGFDHPKPEAVKSGAILNQEKAEALEADAQRRGEAADPGRPDAIYPPPQDRWDLV